MVHYRAILTDYYAFILSDLLNVQHMLAEIANAKETALQASSHPHLD